jgi:hypothetical protein
MKYFSLWLCLCLCIADIHAQVVNRYPFIQSPTQSTAIISWRRAATAIGTVKWGTSAAALTNTMTEASATQTHAINISGLLPNTKYYYQALSDSFTSSIEYFYTAKPDSVRRLDFLVYGDCGFNNSQQDGIAAQMAAKTSEFALVVGDVDQLVGNAYDVDYFQHYTGMLKHQCHFTAIGNHDILTNNTNYQNAFDLPHNNPANSPLYYSFTWGNAKFITIDGNDSYVAGSAQYTWLENELKCNNSEWVFVYFHQPPWSNGWDVSYYIPFTPFYMYEGNTDMRTSIVPLFEQYHVDAVLNGHTHNYERGIYHGVHYFITGGGAASTPDTHTNNNSPDIQFEQSTNQFMQFSIRGDDLHYESIDINGSVIDSATFSKSFTPYISNIQTTDATCLAANGSAVISTTGPRPPYTYSWSSGSMADTITHLAAGTYTVTVTDSVQCNGSYSVSIQNHSSSGSPTIAVAPNSNDTILCRGDSLQLIASLNGLNSGMWNTGATTNALTVYQPGAYYISASDSFGCGTVSNTISIHGDSIIHLQISAGTSSLSAQFTASQSGLSTYTWDFGNGHTISGSSPAVNYTYTDSGTYIVRLITAQNCGTDTTYLSVHVFEPLGIVYVNGGELKLTIAPNPFHYYTVIKIDQSQNSENLHARLYDITGSLISDLGTIINNTLTIQRGRLATGSYLLRLSNAKINTTLRLVIE